MSDSWTAWAVLLHLAATLYMTGLIWFVQIVHYPLMAVVGEPQFAAYEQRHARRTTWVVAPPMLVEGLTAILLLWLRPPQIAALWPILGMVLLLMAWLSTALLQVPCHTRLACGFSASTHTQLVRGNWLRTIAWSVRGVLALQMTATVIAA